MATVHNPTNFNPADYDVLDYLDNRRPAYYGQDVETFAAEVKNWEADMLAVLGDNWRSKIGHCVHCGNGNVRWITAVLHIPTGDRVVFGADCTSRLQFADRMGFKLAQLKSRADAKSARIKVWHQREAFVAAHPAIANVIAVMDEPVHARNAFIHDVIGKLNRYGSLSDAQVNALTGSLARDVEFAARKAAEVTEVKGEAPNGRAVVSGSVLTTKWQSSDYGDTLKMLVKLENNSRVWLTVPGGATIERGDAVTVRATFERKADDPSFAFGKRPFLVNHTSAAVPAA